MTFLIHLFNCYTAKEYNEVVDRSNRIWEANKKLMLQVQDLHNRLEVQKIHPHRFNITSESKNGKKIRGTFGKPTTTIREIGRSGGTYLCMEESAKTGGFMYTVSKRGRPKGSKKK